MRDDVVEQLATADIFDYHVAVSRVGVVEELDELDNVGMVQHLQNCLLTFHQLLLSWGLYLFVFKDLDGNLKNIVITREDVWMSVKLTIIGNRRQATENAIYLVSSDFYVPFHW